MLALIVYNCKNLVRLGVKMDSTVAQAWKTIKKAYGAVLDFAAMEAENWLHTTMFTNNRDFSAHIADIH